MVKLTANTHNTLLGLAVDLVLRDPYSHMFLLAASFLGRFFKGFIMKCLKQGAEIDIVNESRGI